MAALAAVKPAERTAASESASKTRRCTSTLSLGSRCRRTAGRRRLVSSAVWLTGSVSWGGCQ
jgi:hypothetical protein